MRKDWKYIDTTKWWVKPVRFTLKFLRLYSCQNTNLWDKGYWRSNE